MYRKKMSLGAKVFIGLTSVAIGVAATVVATVSAQPRITTTSVCRGGPPTVKCLTADGLSTSGIAWAMAHYPKQPQQCTVTLDTVEAAPGSSLSACIANDPNIPHPAINEPAAAGVAAATPAYGDGTPTLACPSWGPTGGSMAVPEGTKLCPPPPGMKPFTPAQIKAAFTAPTP